MLDFFERPVYTQHNISSVQMKIISLTHGIRDGRSDFPAESRLYRKRKTPSSERLCAEQSVILALREKEWCFCTIRVVPRLKAVPCWLQRRFLFYKGD